MKQTELLAPAGSLEILKSVIHAGADAVYGAGAAFGARAYAKNFTEEEFCEGIQFAHLHQAKVYMTVNTLLKNQEIEQQLYEYLLPYYKAGVDGLIVQDFGVIRFVQKHFPDLPVHGSTQMSVTNETGAAFLKDLGLERVVPAREISLEEIAAIKKTGIEVETFIHGALCYSYSGMCLMSSMLGGRSGNRGRCAGPCRLPYEIRGKKNVYALSLKDIATIDFLPELMEVGIDSFKIEGRMKSIEYATGVVSLYRKYMDLYYEKGAEGYLVTPADQKKLMDFGNRSGFTEGYYKQHNGSDMITYEKPSHSRSESTKGFETSLEEKKLAISGKLRLEVGKPAELQVAYQDVVVESKGALVQEAQKKPLEKENVMEKMKKTGGTSFVFRDLEVEMEPSVFLPISAINELRREALDALQEALLKADVRNQEIPFVRTSYSYKPVQEQQVSVLVTSKEQVEAVAKREFVHRVILESKLFSNRATFLEELKTTVAYLQQQGKEVSFAFPYVFRERSIAFYRKCMPELLQLPISEFLVRNYDTLGFLQEYKVEKERIRLDFLMYTFSEIAKESFSECGYTKQTYSVELKEQEMKHLRKEGQELVIYGYLPLMITANCVHKNFAKCDKKPGREYLKDRYGKVLSVENVCSDCYNLIYNADCLELFSVFPKVEQVGTESLRLQFTWETSEEVSRILDAYADTKKRKAFFLLPQTTYTKGHFHRGVE